MQMDSYIIHSFQSGFFQHYVCENCSCCLMQWQVLEFLLYKYSIIYLPILFLLDTELFLVLIIPNNAAVNILVHIFGAYLWVALHAFSSTWYLRYIVVGAVIFFSIYVQFLKALKLLLGKYESLYLRKGKDQGKALFL